MNILVIAEHDNRRLNPATLHAVAAAARLGSVHVLVAGFQAAAVAAEAALVAGVDEVLHADAEHYQHGLAEETAPLAASLAGDYGYIAAAATAQGKNLAPRIAALLDAPQVSDLTEIVDERTFVRPVYAGNALATVQTDGGQAVLTFRSTAFAPAAAAGGAAAVREVSALPAQNLSRFVARELVQSDRPELTRAKAVVSGGKALGSAEAFDRLLTPLAEVLGAAVGASRAAVDAGYAPNDFQVGQTGKVVAPDLYIAVGISGAIQHLAGMQDSRTIVAINKDPDAPIFSVADYGIVGDLADIVPQLTEALRQR